MSTDDRPGGPATDVATPDRRPPDGLRVTAMLRRPAGLLALLAASAIWGLWITAEKYSLRGLPVMTVLGLSLAGSTLLLWTLLLRRGHRRPPRRQLGRLALLGLFEPMLGYGVIGLGLAHIEAGQASLLAGTEACFVVALAAVLRRRLPTGRAIAGVLLAAVGVAVLGGGPSAMGLTLGDALVLLGSLFAAIGSIIAGRVVQHSEPLVATSYQFGFGLLFTLPLMAWEWFLDDTATTAGARPGHWIVAAVVCGGGLGTAFLLYNYAIIRTPVTLAGVFLNVIPLFGLVFAVLLLGEGVAAWQLIGGAIMIGGIFLFTESDLEE
ncbi:DMT family transporter [Longispora urticae]